MFFAIDNLEPAVKEKCLKNIIFGGGNSLLKGFDD